MGNQWTGWTQLERNCHCGKAWSIDRTFGWKVVSFYVRHWKALQIPTKMDMRRVFMSPFLFIIFYIHLSVVCRLLSRNRTTFYLSLSNRRFKENKRKWIFFNNTSISFFIMIITNLKAYIIHINKWISKMKILFINWRKKNTP